MSYQISRSLISLTILSHTTVCLAETVTLKNGNVLQGSIVQMNETDLTIDTADMGQVVVKRRSVKSINDGVNTTMPEANGNGGQREANGSGAGVAQNVNVNTNVLPQTTVSNPPAPLVSAPVAAAPATPAPSAPASVTPEQTMTTTAIASGNAMIGGHLGFGVTQIKRDDEEQSLQSIDWTLVGIRAPSGFSVSINGQAAQSDEYGSLWMAGFGLGWTSAPPILNDSGSVWEAGIIGGYAQMTRKYKSTDYYWGYENDRSVESSGSYYGGSVGYSYFFNGGFGLHLGISTRMVNLGKQELAEGDSSWNSSAESDVKKDKNLIATNANIGFAYRF